LSFRAIWTKVDTAILKTPWGPHVYEANAARVLSLLRPEDRVLDIGGWGRPFNRANYVMDAMPYETRGYYGSRQGGEREYFSKETWIQRDICDHQPYPFKDKELDFVICSHTLEDVRDPLWVCSEMVRIAKRGYLEVPSRLAESSRGVEPSQVGWSHHRWLVDIEGSGSSSGSSSGSGQGGANEVRFLMKYHMIHSHWRFSLPASFVRRQPEEKQVQWLFWEDRFAFSEVTLHGVDTIAEELERFVRGHGVYSEVRLAADAAARQVKSLAWRAVWKLQRTLRRA